MQWPTQDQFNMVFASLKMFFGIFLLLSIVALAFMVAREGDKLQGVSNGDLQAVLTLLAAMGGGFTQWAFATHHHYHNGVDVTKEKEGK